MTKSRRRGLPEQRGKKRGNGLMDDQLFRFADAYYNASGGKRTYTNAAIIAGVSENSAHTIGSQWARLPQVQEYWKMLDKLVGAEARSAYKRSLLRLESHAENEDLEIGIRLNIEDKIINTTEKAFENGRGEWKDDFEHQLELERLKAKNKLDLAPYSVEASRLKEAEKGRYEAEGKASSAESLANSEQTLQKGHVVLSQESFQTLNIILHSLEYHYGRGADDVSNDTGKTDSNQG